MSALAFYSHFILARIVRALAALVFFAVTLAYAQQAGQRPLPSLSEKTSEAFGKIRALQEAKNWAGVLALLEGIPDVKPGSYDEAVILDSKARTYGVMEQMPKAIAPWERALQISDEHGYFNERQTLEIVLYLAQLNTQEAFATNRSPQQQQEHLAKAMPYYRRYLEKVATPAADVLQTYATVLFQRATVDANRADPALLQEAKAVVERGLASTIKPRESFYSIKVALRQQDNDLAGASELIELMLHQKPDKKDYWQSLVMMYTRLSDEAKDENPALARQYLVRAIIAYERAQELGFLTGSKDRLHLCSLYLAAKQFTKGTEMLYSGMKTGKIDSEPNNWRLLGRFHQEANQPQQAVAVLEEGSRLFPKNGEIEMQLAELHFQGEKVAEAFEHAKAAAEKGNFETTKPFSVYYLIAYTAYDLGKFDEAKQAILAAEKYPEESARDAQFSNLKNAVNDAIAERERRAAGKPRSG
jgi:tetratricopeptide (TPR) repeat protein